MNNNVDRNIKVLAELCKQYICEDFNNCKEKILDLLKFHPTNKIRISQDALNYCLANNISPFNYFTLFRFPTNDYLTFDYNISNETVVEEMLKLYQNNTKADITQFRNILNKQYCDLITLSEKQNLKEKGLEFNGTQEERNKCCSSKIDITDLWLTPKDVIDKFFSITKLNKDECLDPCASDGRWLDGKGLSVDILPTKKHVKQMDFLKMTKEDLPPNIKTIVGNLPFSLLDEFVNKTLELVDDCYFLVSGDTIFKHFPNNIEHIYIFSGLEGNQKDNRSRCEFDVPFLIKSALWCCIVHITKKEQPSWKVECNITNEEKRDGFHVALGKNTFIKSDVLVDENPKITKIPVTSSIIWKGGKKLINTDGTLTDLKTLINYKNL